MEELKKIPLVKFINFSANDYGYSGCTKDLIVNLVHPLFLQTKAAARKEDNPNCRKAMDGSFVDEYLKTAVTQVESLEAMNSGEVVYHIKDRNVLQSTCA